MTAAKRIALAVIGAVGLAIVGAASPVSANASYPTAANGRIVFASQRVTMLDSYDVFVMGADGSNPVNLTPGDPMDTAVDPSFSPDGAKILFLRPAGGDFDVFAMNTDGTNPVSLTANDVTDTTPSYSPDGRKIAFARDVDPSPMNDQFDIFIANADGSGAIDITATRTATQEASPDFSPDGTGIIWCTVDGGDIDYFASGVDGSSPVNLTADNPTADQDAVYTTDGERIALARDVDPGPGLNSDIFLINAADGSGANDIVQGPADDRIPAPSPDGQRLAFERGGQIWIAGINGSDPVNLTGTSGGLTPRWEYVYTCAGLRATVIGTDSADVIKGTSGPDVIVGNGGNDKLVGRGGKDRICGGNGKDRLKGGNGKDRLLGQAGRDKLFGGKGRDVLKGGRGKDIEKQ
jgi:Tol biopolymer transport system component